jgi:hypothetical protein
MPDLEPVHLRMDDTTGDRFLVYGDSNGLHIDVHYEGEELWMTRSQIAQLYGRDVSVITKHMNRIIDDEELGTTPFVHDMHKSTGGRPVTLYSLDMVMAVGFKVSSPQAILFRRWATDKLIQFATKGFVIDSVVLKKPENRDRIAELRDIIRDIRSDEANIYRELRKICALCQDYDSNSDGWRRFYKNTQAKLVYAVCSQTPAEIIAKRADAHEPNMGLQTWPNENIRKADVTVSKNYLGAAEVKELNRLTTILLDIFEDQMDLGRMQTMVEAEKLLEDQLRNLGRLVLQDGGNVKMTTAKTYAEETYQSYQIEQKKLRHEKADEAISEIVKEVRTLPRSKQPKRP